MKEKKALGYIWYLWGSAAILAGGVFLSVRYFPLILKNHTHAQSVVGLGEYGDIYGGLNTLFTGLAFVGLLVTIFIQHLELTETRNEFIKQTEQFKAQSEIMTKQVLDAAMFEYLQYMCNIKASIQGDEYSTIIKQLKKINKVLKTRTTANDCLHDDFWEEVYDVFGQPETTGCEIYNSVQLIRLKLDALTAWREVYSAWLLRVEQTSVTVDNDKAQPTVVNIADIYRTNFWKLLSSEDKFLIHLQIAYLSEMHKDKWERQSDWYNDSDEIQCAFRTGYFDEESQELLRRLLAIVGENPAIPARLSISQVRNIFIDYMRIKDAKT